MNATEAIAKMIEDSKLGPINHWNAAGEPWRYSVKIINGHHVQTNLMGWAEELRVWIDRSSEPLTITEAVARIAA
jgi:hypothetical protein